MNRGRTRATAFVRGNQSVITRTTYGNCSRGKKIPDKNIMGVSTRVK